MKTFNFILIKLTFCLITGILLAHVFDITFNHSLFTSIGLIICLCIAIKLTNRKLKQNIWAGLITYLMMIALGTFSYNTHLHKNWPHHYKNIKGVNLYNSNSINFKIKERLKPTKYYNKYLVELLLINGKTTQGNLLLNIKKDTTHKQYSVDDHLLIHSKLEEIRRPLNPYQFDYKAYLEKQNIYLQCYTEQQFIFKISSKKSSIYGFADELRQTINKQLAFFEFKPEVLAVINALILGQRQDMDRKMYTDYANAGAIHILAVSGLHVGIILMILNFVLKPLEHVKRGKMYKVISILILLWSFAIIAGLSASVTRAVTMFSVVAIAMHLKRPTNIYNTLFISIFILLLVKPMFLFDVGFQMSYLAVFSIVSIQPLLIKLWVPRWKLTNYFWQIFTVTIAAQIGVAPISLFYFHQFPGLFFVSNLVIIPFIGLILGFGILIIVLALLNVLPKALANTYGELINLMNQIVSWVSKQEAFLIKDISFDTTYVIATYFIIVACVLAYQKFNFQRFSIFLISVLALQSVFIYRKYKNNSKEFIIFHKSKHSIYGEKNKADLKIWHHVDSNTIKNETMISNYKVGNYIKSITLDTIHNVYIISNKTLLVIDSMSIYNVNFKSDYVLLRNSPRINLKRMIDSLEPKLIIADGSNYKSYVVRWKSTCLNEKLPFHYTYEKGAFIIKY